MTSMMSPAEALAQLADCRTPWLIGVRHHSAALARVMPALLEQISPSTILLEMPPEFTEWLPHLSREDLQCPVALAAANKTRLISFFPLADFSPEMVAIRWAAKHRVPVIPCDLALEQREDHSDEALDLSGKAPRDGSQRETEDVIQRLVERQGVADSGALWDKLVETPSHGNSPEAIRRAALAYGWTVRCSSGGADQRDTWREQAMREAIAAAPKQSVAIVGAFHAAALLPDPFLWTAPTDAEHRDENAADKKSADTSIVTSLIPYSFQQFDQRSGYPAGILDPVWHQAMCESDSQEACLGRLTDLAVHLCRELRRKGHVAGTPDAKEIVRVATDLARLRRQPVPGRAEFLEAIETVLVQGDLFGRGRAVANAAQTVFLGSRQGFLPHDLPRSGLAVSVSDTLERLRLPNEQQLGDDAKDLRLDPMRSKLDRARAVTLRRMNLARIQYAERVDEGSVGDRENLTEVWRVRWSHSTSAMVEAAGVRGVRLVQVAEAAIREVQGHGQEREDAIDGEHPSSTILKLKWAAECGLGRMVMVQLQRLHSTFLLSATTRELTEAANLVQRIQLGHIPGLPREPAEAANPDVQAFNAPSELLSAYPFAEAALRGFAGLEGSEEIEDAVTLADLSMMIASATSEGADPAGSDDFSSLRVPLRSRLERLQSEGSSLMHGVAVGALVNLGEWGTKRLASQLRGWYDNASQGTTRKLLRERLRGLLVSLLPQMAADAGLLQGLSQALEHSDDQTFLSRLPSLRGGFQSVPTADRSRLLQDLIALCEPLGPGVTNADPSARRIAVDPNQDPELWARHLAADQAGRAAIAELIPDFQLRQVDLRGAYSSSSPISEPPGAITLADRWRLILGMRGCQTPQGRRASASLDQLYGTSEEVRQRERPDLIDRGGKEKPQPTAREWVEDLRSIFDADLCEEILGESVADGRIAMLEYLNADKVEPSADLLQQILSLRGGMPEQEAGYLRKFARRITERLAKELANRLRPALTGLSTARPTRRRSQRLDFAGTIDANLHTAYRRENGRVGLAPSKLIYRSPARRQMDWHLVFVVDVSGSMEASVVYSALVAAIFSALPAISVRFFAFSTEVIDLSNHVDDPLSLLLEVEVGGGTRIGIGLRAARESVKNPQRTMVVLVSDFEEGWSLPEMLSEVKTMAMAGVKLIGLAALDDTAKPRYHLGNAKAMAAAGMAVAAVTPERLAQWVGDQIRKEAS